MAKAPQKTTNPIDDEDDVPAAGHNVSQAAKSLAGFIKRIERLEEEKKALSEDLKLVYAEASSGGFDNKVIREIVKRRRKAKEDVEAFDATLATYETNLDSLLE